MKSSPQKVVSEARVLSNAAYFAVDAPALRTLLLAVLLLYLILQIAMCVVMAKGF